VVWRDEESYLRLDVGTNGPHEVFFAGCIENQDAVFGRGRLPGRAEQPNGSPCVHLRIERAAGHVRALCSVDGEGWFSVGEVEFSGDDALQIGVYANGEIDRLIYPGAHAQGTSIRFLSFQQWGPPV
jgi:hypothetical protein